MKVYGVPLHGSISNYWLVMNNTALLDVFMNGDRFDKIVNFMQTFSKTQKRNFCFFSAVAVV